MNMITVTLDHQAFGFGRTLTDAMAHARKVLAKGVTIKAGGGKPARVFPPMDAAAWYEAENACRVHAYDDTGRMLIGR